jgi:hypothetical protein
MAILPGAERDLIDHVRKVVSVLPMRAWREPLDFQEIRRLPTYDETTVWHHLNELGHDKLLLDRQRGIYPNNRSHTSVMINKSRIKFFSCTATLV